MKIVHVLRLRALLFILLCFCTTSLWAWGWPKDYKPVKQAEAFEVAKVNNKPIAIYYSLSYCPGCRLLESQLRDDKLSSVLAGKINAVSIDPGADINQAERDRIKAEWGQIITPTMTFFSPQGNYVCFMRGTWKDVDHGNQVAQRLLPLLTDANASAKVRNCSEILWKKKSS